MNNNPLNILIVDDEPIARRILESYINKIPEITILGQCKNAIEAFKYLNTTDAKIDIMLMDINMPVINGVDFLSSIKDPPLTIFITAYSEYAVKSYEQDAIDYLVKPISFSRFLKAINKAKEIIQNKNQISLSESTLGNTLNDNILFVKSEGKLVKLELSQLWFIESLKDYIRLWTDIGKFVVHSTMKKFEENLISYPQFLRVHKSFIVNIKHIDEIEGNVVRVKKQEIVIGITYKDEVFNQLNKYKL